MRLILNKTFVAAVLHSLSVFLISMCTGISGVYAVTKLDGCGDLNTKGETYNLINDIVHKGPGDCIVINAENITLDCKSFKISGSSASISGIRINSARSVKVRNCTIEKFRTGIMDVNGVSNIIEFNTVRFNSGSGMSISSVDGAVMSNISNDNSTNGISVVGVSNYIYNNTVRSNNKNGIVIIGSGNNKAKVNIKNNKNRIFAKKIESNYIVKNRTTSNGENGIFLLLKATGNLVYANVSEKNKQHGIMDHSPVNNKLLNTYTRNRCSDNLIGDSSPKDLCEP